MVLIILLINKVYSPKEQVLRTGIKNHFKELVYMAEQVFINDVEVNFNLRKPNGEKPTMIYFVVCMNKKQVKLSTGVKIYPDHWNTKKQEAYVSVRLSELDNVNNTIVNDKLAELKRYFAEYKLYLCEHPNEMDKGIELLKKYIYRNTMVRRETKKHITNPIFWLRKNIEEDINIKGDGRTSTKSAYQGQLDRLAEYLKKKDIELKSFEDINSKLLADFQNYLVNEYTFKRNGEFIHLKRKYINSLVNNIKVLLYRAVEAGELENSKYQNIVVKSLADKEGDDNAIYLREDEIFKLYNYKPENEADEHIRDLFLLNCVTGQRISDTKKLDDTINRIEGLDVITLVQKKGNKKIIMCFVFELAKKILVDKYNYELPYCNDDKMNERIKIIAKNAGIVGTEIIQEHRGTDSTPVEISKPRYECIATHTGRRTFISLLKLRGWDNTKIQRYSGHKDMKQIEKYCKLRDVDYQLFERNKKFHPERLLKLMTDEIGHSDIFGMDKSEEILPTNEVKQAVKTSSSITFDTLLDTQFLASKVNKANELATQVGYLKNGKLCSYDSEVKALVIEIEEFAQSFTSDFEVSEKFVKQLSVWKQSDLRDSFKLLIVNCVKIGLSRDSIMQFIDKAYKMGILDDSNLASMNEIIAALLDAKDKN